MVTSRLHRRHSILRAIRVWFGPWWGPTRMWLINTKRGQHNGMMFVGGLGGWFRGAVVSAGVWTGHSRSAAARPWSRCCPACGGPGLATCWAGWTSLPGHEVHETSEADWVLAAGPRMPPVLLLGFGIDVPKANGTGRHGWWCGCARLCPTSVGWRRFIHVSTIVLSEVN